MATELEDLEILQLAEDIADNIWEIVLGWNYFERDTIGKQMARAVDSIGANISEAYGRYHFGEKIRFCYYARGSIYESKYWLNRALKRKLILELVSERYVSKLTNLARKLNSFISSLMMQQKNAKDHRGIKENIKSYKPEIRNRDRPIWETNGENLRSI
jgi:four helix bundle protein